MLKQRNPVFKKRLFLKIQQFWTCSPTDLFSFSLKTHCCLSRNFLSLSKCGRTVNKASSLLNTPLTPQLSLAANCSKHILFCIYIQSSVNWRKLDYYFLKPQLFVTIKLIIQNLFKNVNVLIWNSIQMSLLIKKINICIGNCNLKHCCHAECLLDLFEWCRQSTLARRWDIVLLGNWFFYVFPFCHLILVQNNYKSCIFLWY